MIKEHRGASRRPLRYTAWVALEGETLHGCVISDISDTGARLDLEEPEKLPEKFVLLLSNRGSPKRKCKVIWRTETQIGVEFDRRLPQAVQAPIKRRPQPSAAPEKMEANEATLVPKATSEVEPAEKADAKN